jgi:hypothetical protein
VLFFICDNKQEKQSDSKKGMKNTKKAMIGNAAGRHFFLKKTNDHAK